MWAGPPNTMHLFNCPDDPTEHNPRILWEDPPSAATFLGLATTRDAADLDDND